jgi:hypothetical protein
MGTKSKHSSLVWWEIEMVPPKLKKMRKSIHILVIVSRASRTIKGR